MKRTIDRHPPKRSHPTHACCEAVEPRWLLSVARPSYNTGTGFFVANGNVYDANGNPFVMKGVNAIHAWGSYNTNYATIDQVARTGANAVRAVMYQDISTDSSNPYTDAANTPARRKAVVERYLAQGMVAVVEDHAAITDYADSQNPAALAEVTTHWLSSASWLKQYERGVILNIANEWGPVVGASGSNTVWRDTYIAQVARLRQGPDGVIGTGDDITNLISIDAAGYGQDYNSLALHAQQILDADPQHNILFSIHAYGQWRDEARSFEVSGGNTDYGPWDLKSRLGALRNRPNPLPLVIGEFAWEDFRDFSNGTAPFAGYRTQRLLQIADELGIGWTGWSYNQSSPDTLNMIAGSLNNANYTTNADLSDWGNALVNDPVYGLKASAVRASVFPMSGLPAAPAGLPALPAAPPATLKFILESTRINVAENGAATVRARLSEAPAANVDVSIARLSGDGSIAPVTTSLSFTPADWNVYQTIVVAAAADADASNGTATVQLTAAGLASTDFAAREIDASLALGTTVLNPVADRGYSSGGTSASLTVNATTAPQPTGAMFLRFDASPIGGKVATATLRLFKTTATTNASLRVWAVLNDTWTESGTNGINNSYVLGSFPIANTANAYVDLDVSAFVRSELFKGGLVSFAVSTVSGSATFQTLNGTSKPQLVISSVEAVPPQVTSIAFDYAHAPNRLLVGFDEDVSPTLAASDLILSSPSGADVPTIGEPVFDSIANVWSFTLNGPVADGRYRVTLPVGAVSDAAGNGSVQPRSYDFFSLAGDINHSAAVDFDDLLILAANYGGASRTFAQGDLTGNDVVDFDDLLILARQYGKTLPPVAIALPARAASTRRTRAIDVIA